MNEERAIWRGGPSLERIRLIRRSIVKTVDGDNMFWSAHAGEKDARWHKLDRPVDPVEYAALNAWLDSVCPR